ncbi:MAG: hypothetical protein ATN36_08300 [Epulopiscium sp. Nele67-Bin005]|nr:MAG: hypothetical protein ATN36_08300 [Epulopiscium sp. Nele67-Bin005]
MKKNATTFVYSRRILRGVQICVLLGMMQSFILVYFDAIIGWQLCLVMFVLLVYLTKLCNTIEKKMQDELLMQVGAISEIRKNLFIYFKLPILAIDKNGVIWWLNDAFINEICEEDLIGTNIDMLIPQLPEDFPKRGDILEYSVNIGDKYYDVVIESYHDKVTLAEPRYVFYFLDTTQEVLLKKQVKAQQPIVGYLSVDNIDEVMQSVEEFKQPMLEAVIHRKLSTWFLQHNTAITKYDRDKYIFFFTATDLIAMNEKKFEILDEIRAIQMKNDLPITISIGIGTHKSTLVQSQEDAKIALDLALARGGDQAIIKDNDKYTFDGGKTKEVEKSTRVKARLKAYAFKELLQNSEDVYIMGHRNMDMDCLGAAIGVYRAATFIGKKAHIILNSPSYAIESLYDRIMEQEEYKGIFISGTVALQKIQAESLLVVVDAHRKSYLEVPEVVDYAKKIVIFDHHRRNTDYIDNAVLSYIEPFISSTCEMIAEILNYISEKIKLTPLEADALLAGITMDTKNFVFKTGVRTFEAAAFLRRAGANSNRVQLLFQNDMELCKIKAKSISEVQIYQTNLAIATVEADSYYANLVAAQVADELLNIKNIEGSFVLTLQKDTILISARARECMNVQLIMEMLGGGGHKNIAGAQLKDTTMDDAIVKLKETIDKHIKEGE